MLFKNLINWLFCIPNAGYVCHNLFHYSTTVGKKKETLKTKKGVKREGLIGSIILLTLRCKFFISAVNFKSGTLSFVKTLFSLSKNN